MREARPFQIRPKLYILHPGSLYRPKDQKRLSWPGCDYEFCGGGTQFEIYICFYFFGEIAQFL